MALDEEIAAMLTGGRIERPVDGLDEEYVIADVKNLRAAVHELQAAVVRLARELDRRVPE